MPRSLRRLLSAVALAAPVCVAPLLTLGAQATATAVAPAPSTGVTLLDAGAAPRRTLRYVFTKGSSESVSMRQQMGMAMELNGMAMPAQTIPATLMTTRIGVADVAADGTADVRVEIVRVDVDTVSADPMVVAQMRPALAPLSGVTLNYRMSPSGVVSALAASPGAPPELQSAQALGSTEQLSVALPTEPVGLGARWKATRTVQQNGLSIEQDMEYTLKAIAQDSVVLDLVVVQTAKEQTLTLPAAPPDAEATLRSLNGRGTSSVVIRFDRVQPQMDMTLKAVMVMDIKVGADDATMQQTMTMNLRTLPAPPQ